MLSIRRIIHANGIYFTSGGFVLFRGLLAKGIRFADLTGFILAFAFFGLPGGLLSLLVDYCYLLCFTSRKERGTRTRGKCLFYTV